MKRLLSILFALALLLAALTTGCHREPEPTPSPPPTVDPHAGEVEVLDPSGGTMWVPRADALTPFGRTATDFNVVDQIPYYAKSDLTMIQGIDVSDHQEQIDWQQVADYGIEFAIIRCGYRSYGEGVLHEDNRFRDNIQGALDAGLRVGVYFFSQALDIVEAAEEALFTLDLIKDYDVQLPVFFDWENIEVDAARTDNTPGSTITDCAVEFCRLIQAAGYEPGVYTFLYQAYFRYELDRLKDFTLWMGDPGTKPIFYYDHDYWQYSYTASVPGIGVNVDLDAMYLKDPNYVPPLITASPEPVG